MNNMDYYEYGTDFSLTTNRKKGGGGSKSRKGNQQTSNRKQKQEQKHRNQQMASVYSSKHIRVSVQKNTNSHKKVIKKNKKQ